MQTPPDNQVAIAIDVDSERILGALVDQDGDWFALEMFPVDPTMQSQELISAILNQCQRLQKSTGLAIRGAGISLSAYVNSELGNIVDAWDLPADLVGIPLREVIGDVLHVPVLIENSANAIAYAEYRIGAGKDCQDMFYIHAGRGIDGAIINEGRVWHGRNSGAGQIANIVADWMGLKPIDLSHKASGTAIAAEYNMRSRKFRTPGLPDIIQYASQGDQLAIRVLRDGARTLGSVLRPIVRLLDPQRVVVGGELMQIGSLWLTPFSEALLKEESPNFPPIELQPAALQDEARIIGVGLLVHAGDPE
jgi:glucokinase